MTKPMSAAQSAQQNNRDSAGKYSTRMHPEAGLELEDAAAPAEATQRALDTVAAIRSMIEHRAFDDWERLYGQEFPAFAGDVHETTFAIQMIHPIHDAVVAGDDAEATRLIERLHQLSDRELTALASGWEPGHTYVTEKDTMYGDRVSGEFYDPRRKLSEVSKLIRNDIKGAAAAGYLPEEYTYRVTTSKGSIRINVEGMPDDDALFRDENSAYAGARGFHTVPSWQRLRMVRRHEQIGNSYAEQKSNSMVDYFADSHYTFVEVESESGALFWAHERELAKLKKAVKNAPDSERAELAQAAAARKAEMESERREKREIDREKWGW